MMKSNTNKQKTKAASPTTFTKFPEYKERELEHFVDERHGITIDSVRLYDFQGYLEELEAWRVATRHTLQDILGTQHHLHDAGAFYRNIVKQVLATLDP